jgi:sugar (glycoside-pentoside-hexuronide) transporter
MPPLSKPRLFGYALGDLGINLNFQMVGFYLAYFYTDVFGLAAAQVGWLFLLVRIVDAVLDPIMGYIADHTSTRWGRFRPYVLLGALPLNLLLVACFVTPELPPFMKLVYAYLTYVLHGVLFTVVGLPYSSLTAAMTQDQQERSLIATFRMFFAVIVALTLVSVGVRPFVQLFATERTGFAVAAALFAVASTLLLWASAAFARERVAIVAEPYGITDVGRLIARNTALLVLSAAMFLNTCVWVVGSAVALYYFKYVLGRPELQTTFFLLMLPANLVGALISPYLTRRFGKNRMFAVASLLVGLLLIVRHLLPVDALTPFLVISMLFTTAQMVCAITQWGMLPDTVEFGEWRTGKRSEGIPYAFFSFTQKLGMAAGGAAAAFFLAQTGYTPNAEQSPTALSGIRYLFNLVPAGCSLVCFVTLLLYRLDASLFERIKLELAARIPPTQSRNAE